MSTNLFGLRERKRRASRACGSCKARKVRCDVVKTGFPCSDCRSEGYECTIPERKKRRTTVRKSLDGDEEEVAASIHGQRRDSGLSQHAILHQIPHYPFLVNFAHIPTDSEDRFSSPPLSANQDTEKDAKSSEDAHVISDEILYLRKKGALDLPEKKILDVLVSHYFQIVHPFFPVIDKIAFLSKYEQLDPHRPHSKSSLSLMLLQAVLFSASSVVPVEVLKEAGYSSRKQARRVLYNTTKLLYNFDYESDNVVNIQTLLLISHYYPSMIDQKHTWHWVNQAVTLAQGVGLHRNPGDLPQRHMWARIWWCCVLRDRLTGLGTGRPLHINSLDCDVPMLTSEDLRETGDREQELSIKQLFIELVKLCQYMEGVISLRYSTGLDTQVTPDQLKVCDEALQLWLHNFSAVAVAQETSLFLEDGPNIAALYQAILRQLYNVTIIGLHQPHHPHFAQDFEFQQHLQQKVRLAAIDATQCITQIVDQDLVKYCPTFCVTCVIPPLMVHLLEIRASITAATKRLAMNQFEICMTFLRQLGDTYWHAAFYHDFFQLAASIENDEIEQKESSSKDPLIAFLQEKMGHVGRMAQRNNHQSTKRIIRPLEKISNMLSVENQGKDLATNISQTQPKTINIDALGNFQNHSGVPEGSSTVWTETSMPSITAALAPQSLTIDSTDPTLDDWTNGSIYRITDDDDVEFEEWLTAWGAFQNIFPSA